jgi:hypothetical protein
MNQSLKTLFFLLLSQLLFAQKCVIIQTEFSKGVVFQKDNLSNESGDFIPDRKQVLQFESTLQEAIMELKVGDTLGLSIPKPILNLDLSNYYRKYRGLDFNRKNTRIFVTFIPKKDIENMCDEESWITLIDSNDGFAISYYLESNTILCHSKRKE